MTQTELKKILYIEDNPGLARLMQKRLKRHGYAVETADDTTIGGAMLAQQPYQLLLIDQNLPGQNGLDFVRELVEKSIHIPTIMVTASGNEELAVAIMKLGAGDYITKDTEGRYFELLPPLIERLLEYSDLQAQKALADQALKVSEEKFRTMADYAYDWEEWILPDGTYEYVSPSCARITGYSPAEFYRREIQLMDMVVPEDRDLLSKHHQTFLSEASYPPSYFEFRIICKDGSQRWIGRNCQSVMTPEGKWLGRRTSNRDISVQKKVEEQLRILSLYDALTGLYNRNYYEQELTRLKGGRELPLGLIVFDVDGLKLVNDTLGHQCGDTLIQRSASILKTIFREGDMVARTGGDEFVVTLSNSDESVMQQAIQRIRQHLVTDNQTPEQFPLSLSMGYAIVTELEMPGQALDVHALYKHADDMMYQDKSAHRQAFKKAAFQFMVATHKKRRVNYAQTQQKINTLVHKMADAVTLSPEERERLELLANYFDIGIVGVSEQLFSKQRALSEEEATEMHAHCDVGCRLADFFEELMPIANDILMHHKNWDGSGYPNAKKGQLPTVCCIMSIVIAYTSMTNHRPFAKAMTHEAAMRELLHCKGTQFNPAMVDIFAGLFDHEPG